MRQHPFEKLHAHVWQQFDQLQEHLGTKADPVESYELPDLYRRICQHYALAQSRYYSPHLISALHRRVYLGHQLLYRQKSSWFWRSLSFLMTGFPTQVRNNHKYFWLSSLLFLLPAILMGVGSYLDNEFIYSVMNDENVSSMEYLYDPTNDKIGRDSERQADTNFQMFGFYILNNISIGFRCFAMGILLGIGTVFLLVYNGLILGAVAGHLTQLGYSETFWPFVCGHSAFELTAIVICGAAGLRLARPVIGPGRFTRTYALRIAGVESVQMVLGAAIMLTLAAFLEAFWSPLALVNNETKYFVAICLWAVVAWYFLTAGKNSVEHR